MPVSVSVNSKKTTDKTPILSGDCDVDSSNISLVLGGDGFNDYPALTTRSIGGSWMIETDPLPVLTKNIAFATSNLEDANKYASESYIFQTNDGNFLAFFRRGNGHVSNDGRIVGAISTDFMVSWGAEFEIYDSPTNFDTRNQAGGVDEESGRVVLFVSIYDVTNTTRIDCGFLYSDDHGVTWSNYTSLIPEFPIAAGNDVVPYGPMIKTSKGLMQLFYFTQDAWALFSTDGGVTWGGRVDLWTNQPSNTYAEPSAVKVDDDRIVVVIRDQVNTDSFRYMRTSDGGGTWSTISNAFGFTSSSMIAAAPFHAVLSGDQIISAITPRANLFKVYTDRVGKENFWATPQLAWAQSSLFKDIGVHNAVTNTNIDFGYAWLTTIREHPTRTVLSFYDESGDIGGTSIYTVSVKDI